MLRLYRVRHKQHGMLRDLRLLGTRPRGLALQTRAGNDIPNEQALPPDTVALGTYARLAAQHQGWVQRRPACGIYNCAGHVFASRRTAVYETAHYDRILAEDQYTLLADSAEPCPGDVAVYRLRTTEAIIHVGIVVEIRTATDIPRGDQIRVPWILSKWNDFSGECVHESHDVPFDKLKATPEEGRHSKAYKLEYWTDRYDA